MIHSISLEQFTAFQKLDIQFSSGINVFIGANSTGKSHLLKVMYALCAANRPEQPPGDVGRQITEKIRGVFKPEGKIGRLCHGEAAKAAVHATVSHNRTVALAFSNDMDEVVVTDNQEYGRYIYIPVFIPPKEMLSSFPGFSSLYLQRELTADETYFDLCQALETPPLKELPALVLEPLEMIKATYEGEFLLVKKQRFYYKPEKGRMLEVELAAEGFRKLGMLQRLLQNGRISPTVSGPLFWDEPEANLNPALMKSVVLTLLDLARKGQQIFLATHDYVILKWLDLLSKDADQVVYHSLFHDQNGEIAVNSTANYLDIRPNAIDDTFAKLVDKDIERTMGDLGK
ncbi:MAG: AAA family ATPase [Desulfobacterales bacterium]|nr:AAA family ATPase [Desulfobacterales bacterium]